MQGAIDDGQRHSLKDMKKLRREEQQQQPTGTLAYFGKLAKPHESISPSSSPGLHVV